MTVVLLILKIIGIILAGVAGNRSTWNSSCAILSVPLSDLGKLP